MNMSRRLRNIERMHPAMHLSACPSRDMSMHGVDLSPFSGCKEGPETDFNRELETSPVYKRVASKNRRVSQSSSNAASGLTFLSRLSLSDVSNVTAMALPISSTELWNHHRYATRAGPGAKPEGLTLDAWYYPPAKVWYPHGCRRTMADTRERRALSSELLISMVTIPTSMRRQSSLAI